jgi:RNA polymerase-binding transcription factor DksA
MRSQPPSADLRYFEEILRERRRKLRQQIQEILQRSHDECSVSLHDDVIDTKDEAAVGQLTDACRDDVRRGRDELAGIDVALARIAAGTYENCTNCGRAIGFERLRSQPAAIRCMPCQEIHENSVSARRGAA